MPIPYIFLIVNHTHTHTNSLSHESTMRGNAFTLLNAYFSASWVRTNMYTKEQIHTRTHMHQHTLSRNNTHPSTIGMYNCSDLHLSRSQQTDACIQTRFCTRSHTLLQTLTRTQKKRFASRNPSKMLPTVLGEINTPIPNSMNSSSTQQYN